MPMNAVGDVATAIGCHDSGRASGQCAANGRAVGIKRDRCAGNGTGDFKLQGTSPECCCPS